MNKVKPCIGTIVMKFGPLWPWLLRKSDLPRYIEIDPVLAIARKTKLLRGSHD